MRTSRPRRSRFAIVVYAAGLIVNLVIATTTGERIAWIAVGLALTLARPPRP